MQWEWKEDKRRGDGNRPLCHAPADPRRTTESERGLGGGERKVSTFPSPPYYSRWGWRSKCGRGEGPRRLDELYKLVFVADDPLARCGPARIDLKVRGCPFLSKLRTGAAKSGRIGEAHEGGTTGQATAGGRGGSTPTDKAREEPGATGSAPPAEPKA
jgi:hypothetical protein